MTYNSSTRGALDSLNRSRITTFNRCHTGHAFLNAPPKVITINFQYGPFVTCQNIACRMKPSTESKTFYRMQKRNAPPVRCFNSNFLSNIFFLSYFSSNFCFSFAASESSFDDFTDDISRPISEYSTVFLSCTIICTLLCYSETPTTALK